MQCSKGSQDRMYDDIAEFKRFYQTKLGQSVADLIRRQLDLFWHAGSPLSLAFLGYAQPFLDPKPPIPLGLMPARRGAASWPNSSSVRNCLVDPLNLPLPDVHVDRLLLVHALEFEHDPGQCLDECWRVLDGAGRLLVIAPNRSGLWAKAESTPFGHGRPYSGRQLCRLLQRHGFIPRQTRRIAFMPPVAGQFFQRFAPTIERIGSCCWPAMGGVLLVEADKMLYAPSGKASKLQRRETAATPALVGQSRGALSPKI